MDVLLIFYCILVVVTLLLALGMFLSKHEKKTWAFFISLLIWTMLIGIISFTSLPSNYVGQRILTVIWCALGIIAYLVRVYLHKDQLSKILLVIAAILGIIWMF